MGWYRTGTVDVTTGSVDVYGTDTLFLSQVREGQTFVGPDGIFYEIQNVVSDTHLQLHFSKPYAGTTATGQGYSVIRTGERLTSTDLITNLSSHVEYHKHLLDDQSAWHSQLGTIDVYNPYDGSTVNVKTWKQIELEMIQHGIDMDKGAFAFGDQEARYWDFFNSHNTNVGNWYNAVEVTIANGLYKACSIEIEVLDSQTNYGHDARSITERFTIAIVRSEGTEDDKQRAYISGTRAGMFRVERTAFNTYIIQFSPRENYRDYSINYFVTSQIGATINWLKADTKIPAPGTGVIFDTINDRDGVASFAQERFGKIHAQNLIEADDAFRVANTGSYQLKQADGSVRDALWMSAGDWIDLGHVNNRLRLRSSNGTVHIYSNELGQQDVLHTYGDQTIQNGLTVRGLLYINPVDTSDGLLLANNSFIRGDYNGWKNLLGVNASGIVTVGGFGTSLRLTSDDDFPTYYKSGVGSHQIVTTRGGQTIDGDTAINGTLSVTEVIEGGETLSTKYVLESERGQAGGFTPLDGNARIPTQYLPPLAISETFVVTSEAEMLALVAQQGDVAIRQDLEVSFILADNDPTILANWLEIDAAGKVTSVNGKDGGVTLDYGDFAGAESILLGNNVAIRSTTRDGPNWHYMLYKGTDNRTYVGTQYHDTVVYSQTTPKWYNGSVEYSLINSSGLVDQTINSKLLLTNGLDLTGISHVHSDVYLDNNTSLRGRNLDGSSRNIAKITTGNNLDLGESSYRTVMLSSQTPSWYTSGTFYDFLHAGPVDQSKNARLTLANLTLTDNHEIRLQDGATTGRILQYAQDGALWLQSSGVVKFSGLSGVDAAGHPKLKIASGEYDLLSTYGGQNILGTFRVSNAVTFDNRLTVEGESRINDTLYVDNIVINNPGLGNSSTINFLKNSDSAKIIVTEVANDNTEFQFFMSDNPSSSTDKFFWQMDSWEGVGRNWRPLMFSGFKSYINADDTYFDGRLRIGNKPYYFSNSTKGIYTTGASNQGDLTLNIDVSLYSGGNRGGFHIKFTDATTFEVRTGTHANSGLRSSGHVVTIGQWMTIDLGVKIRFNGTGAVAGDTYTFGVAASGEIFIDNNVKTYVKNAAGVDTTAWYRDENNVIRFGDAAYETRLVGSNIKVADGSDSYDIVHTGGGQSIAGLTTFEDIDYTGTLSYSGGANMVIANNVAGTDIRIMAKGADGSSYVGLMANSVGNNVAGVLSHNGSFRITATANGVDIFGADNLVDFGFSHDGSNAYFSNKREGTFYITNSINGGDLVLRGRTDSGTNYDAIRVAAGASSYPILYHNGVEKLQVWSASVKLEGASLDLDNNYGVRIKDSADNQRSVLWMGATDWVELGQHYYQTQIRSKDPIKYYNGSVTEDLLHTGGGQTIKDDTTINGDLTLNGNLYNDVTTTDWRFTNNAAGGDITLSVTSSDGLVTQPVIKAYAASGGSYAQLYSDGEVRLGVGNAGIGIRGVDNAGTDIQIDHYGSGARITNYRAGTFQLWNRVPEQKLYLQATNNASTAHTGLEVAASGTDVFGVVMHNSVEKLKATAAGVGITGDATVSGKVDFGNSVKAYSTTNGLKVETANGYLKIGPENQFYAHYVTDAETGHHFNKPVQIDGNLRVRNGGTTYEVSTNEGVLKYQNQDTDDRYGIKAYNHESRVTILQSDIATDGWYRIVSSAGRLNGRLMIKGVSSNAFQELEAFVDYAAYSVKGSLNILRNTKYNQGPVREIRVSANHSAHGGTEAEIHIDVRLVGASDNMLVAFLGFHEEFAVVNEVPANIDQFGAYGLTLDTSSSYYGSNQYINDSLTPNIVAHNSIRSNVFSALTGQELLKLDSGVATVPAALKVTSGTSGDATIVIEADTDNNNETDNPFLYFVQDAGATQARMSLDSTNAFSLDSYSGSVWGNVFKSNTARVVTFGQLPKYDTYDLLHTGGGQTINGTLDTTGRIKSLDNIVLGTNGTTSRLLGTTSGGSNSVLIYMGSSDITVVGDNSYPTYLRGTELKYDVGPSQYDILHDGNLADKHIARRVMKTINGTASDAGYWAKIATVDLAAMNYSDASLLLYLINEETSAPGDALISVKIRQNASGNDTLYLDWIANAGTVFNRDAFKIVSNGHSSVKEIWVQKASSWNEIAVYEQARNIETGGTVTYHDGAAWVVDEPTGTSSVRSSDLKFNNKFVYHEGNKQDHLPSEGTNTSNLKVQTFDLMFGYADQSSRGNSGSSRAMVKQSGSLDINHQNDFGNLVLNGLTEVRVKTPTLVAEGSIQTTAGAGALKLKASASDHVFAEFYARTADQATRSAYIGFNQAGSNIFRIKNELAGGDIYLDSVGVHTTGSARVYGGFRIGNTTGGKSPNGGIPFSQSGDGYSIHFGNPGGTGNESFIPVNTTTAQNADLGRSNYRWRNLYIDGIDATGNVSVAGSLTVNGSEVITGVNGKAPDSEKLDGFDSSQFLRSDVDDTASENITFEKKARWIDTADGEAFSISRGVDTYIEHDGTGGYIYFRNNAGASIRMGGYNSALGGQKVNLDVSPDRVIMSYQGEAKLWTTSSGFWMPNTSLIQIDGKVGETSTNLVLNNPESPAGETGSNIKKAGGYLYIENQGPKPIRFTGGSTNVDVVETPQVKIAGAWRNVAIYKTANGYEGLTHSDGGDTDWIRTTVNGIIPHNAGGASSLGTTSWNFNAIYGVTLYENNVSLAAKYLGIDAIAANSEQLDGLNSTQFIRSDVADSVTADTTWSDGSKVRLGSDADMEIYHSGSHGSIYNGTGDLVLVGRGNNTVFIRTGATPVNVVGANNGTAYLYKDGAAKLNTTTTGVDVAGDVEATGEVTSEAGVVNLTVAASVKYDSVTDSIDFVFA